MTPLVIVPARAGSKGVPNKNWRPLPDSSTLVSRAVEVGQQLGRVVISTDMQWTGQGRAVVQVRDAALAADDTPMSAVVSDVLSKTHGPDDQVIVLLQPTVPFRDGEFLRAALSHLDVWPSVATARRVPEAWQRSVALTNGRMTLPPRRQQSPPRLVFTGTLYAWRRSSVWPEFWSPIADESDPYVNVDTEDDWDEACEIIRRRQTDASAPQPSSLPPLV